MATQIDGSFGPVAATAAAAAATAAAAAAAAPQRRPPSRRHRPAVEVIKKISAVFFVWTGLNGFRLFGPFWTVLDRFWIVLDRFGADLDSFRTKIWSHL